MRISDWSSDVCSSDLTCAESALNVRPGNSPATRRLKGPGTVPSSIRPYMHTHRRADSCQRAALLRRGWRVKTRPALASGSEDVAAQVLVLHQLAQVLVAEIGRESCGERVGQYV